MDFLNCVRGCIDPPCTPGTQAGGGTAETPNHNISCSGPDPAITVAFLSAPVGSSATLPQGGPHRTKHSSALCNKDWSRVAAASPCSWSLSGFQIGCICSVAPKTDLEPKNQEIPAHLAVRTPASSVQEGTPEETLNWCEMCQSSVSKETLILLKLISATLQKVMLKYLICVTFLFPRGLWEGNKDPYCVFLMLLVMVLVNMCSINGWFSFGFSRQSSTIWKYSLGFFELEALKRRYPFYPPKGL